MGFSVLDLQKQENLEANTVGVYLYEQEKEEEEEVVAKKGGGERAGFIEREEVDMMILA